MAAKDTDDRKPDDQEAEISLDMSQAQGPTCPEIKCPVRGNSSR